MFLNYSVLPTYTKSSLKFQKVFEFSAIMNSLDIKVRLGKRWNVQTIVRKNDLETFVRTCTLQCMAGFKLSGLAEVMGEHRDIFTCGLQLIIRSENL